MLYSERASFIVPANNALVLLLMNRESVESVARAQPVMNKQIANSQQLALCNARDPCLSGYLQAGYQGCYLSIV